MVGTIHKQTTILFGRNRYLGASVVLRMPDVRTSRTASHKQLTLNLASPGMRGPFLSNRNQTIAGDYLTLLPTVLTAFASTTWWISLPCLTTTKCRFIGEFGFPGTLITATPVQSGFTV